MEDIHGFGKFLLLLSLAFGFTFSAFGITWFFRRPKGTDGQGLPLADIRWRGADVVLVWSLQFALQLLLGVWALRIGEATTHFLVRRQFPRSAETLFRLLDKQGLPELGTTPLYLLLFYTLPYALFTIVLVLFTVVRLSRSPVAALGLRLIPSVRKLFELGLLLACFLLPCQAVRFLWVALLRSFGYEPENQQPVQIFIDAVQAGDVVGWLSIFVGAVLLAPVVEELLYRGLVHGFLSRKLGFRWAALLSSLLFSVVHFNLSVGIPIFVLGVLLSAIYERRGSLYDAIFFHALFNGVSLTGILLILCLRPDWVL